MKEIIKLKALGACEEAVEWLKDRNTFQQAWQECQRGDWMLWLLKRKLDLTDESQLRLLTLAKVRCAKLVIHRIKDPRSKKAVEVAEAFGNGTATRIELDAAAAAYAAAYAAADADAYADTVQTVTLAKCADEVRRRSANSISRCAESVSLQD